MAERLEDVRPGPLATDIRTGEERRTGEEIRSRKNIENVEPPRGAKFMGRVVSHAQTRVAKFGAWARNLSDRMDSYDQGNKVEKHKGYLNAFSSAKDRLLDRQDKWRTMRENIQDSDSLMNRFAAGRWINARLIGFARLNENLVGRRLAINNRKTAERQASFNTAQDDKRFFDARIMQRIDATNKRLDSKLAPIESFREKIDARALQLSQSTQRYEQTLAKLDERIAALKIERRTGEQGEEVSAQRERQIEKLRETRRQANNMLKKGEKALEKCFNHQIRLAKGHHILHGTKESLIARYHRKSEAISAPKTARTETVRDTTETDEVPTIASDVVADDRDIMIEAEKKNFKNSDFTRLWNDTLPGAPVRSYKKLIEMYKNTPEAVREGGALEDDSDAENKERSIESWIKLLTQLNKHSSEFRNMLAADPSARNFNNAMDLLRITAWAHENE